MIKHLTAVLGLDKTGFDAGMAAAGKQVNQFGAGLKSSLAGAFGASAFIALGRSAIEAADGFDEMSERLGITNKQAQEFSLAAKLGGSDSEFFSTKFEKLRKSLREGIAKGENPLAAFGLDATADPVQAIEALARIIQDTGLNAEQATAMVDLFGKGAGRMVNVLGDLKNAKSGALFFSDNDIQSLKDADDLLTKIGKTAKVAFSKVALFSTSLKGASFMSNPLLGALDIGGAGKKKNATIDETGILERQAAAGAAAKVHMAEQDDLLKIQADANRIFEQNRVAKLTTEERMNELLKEQKTLRENLIGTEEDEIGTQMMRKRLAEVEAGIISGEKLKTPKGAFKINETAMGRIGAFTGAAASAALPPGQAQQLQQLQKIYDAMVIRGIVVRDSR
jgi:hypothetical protein